jgi:polyprenyl-phospho-N-acetylgalactosaminyl synthase
MTLFQLILTCTGILFVLVSIDLYQRQKFNLLHFLVFFGGTAWVVVASVRPELLDRFGQFFWVASGSDLIVYSSIIFLVYLFFELIHKQTRQQAETTKLCTAHAIREYNRDKKVASNWSDDPKARYGFLIRAYNEWTMLGDVIEEIIAAWFSTIVVCNDGSSDSTEEVVNEKAKQHTESRIIWLNHLINRGPGAANKTLFVFGSQYAESLGIERRVTYDADWQMSIADMEWFMAHADITKYDLVIGSRFVEWSVVENMPVMRRIILIWWRVVTWIFNGLWVTDVPTGYRMYHATTLPKIQISSDRFSYQNEIIWSMRRHRLRYIEIPVHIKYTEYSLAKWQKNLSALKILKELVYRTLFFK